MDSSFNNSNYGASLGAAEVCPTHCGVQCDYRHEIACYDTTDVGCPAPGYCMQTSFAGQGIAMRNMSTCPVTCPTYCGKLDISCDMGVDQNGCSLGSYCMPAATRSPVAVGFDCPSVCYQQCDWNTETSCPMYDELGCFMGNTCEPLAMRQADACGANGGMAMRALNREDHEMLLRDNSPSSVRKFYEKLMALQ